MQSFKNASKMDKLINDTQWNFNVNDEVQTQNVDVDARKSYNEFRVPGVPEFLSCKSIFKGFSNCHLLISGSPDQMQHIITMIFSEI